MRFSKKLGVYWIETELSSNLKGNEEIEGHREVETTGPGERSIQELEGTERH